MEASLERPVKTMVVKSSNSGNKFTRDLAEDHETEMDRDSMHPKNEQTHTRRNHKHFKNVSVSLKEVRIYKLFETIDSL